MLRVLRSHWREYLSEAIGLGAFMVSACLFAALLEYPGSAARAALPNAELRRSLMGVAMGATAIGIVYSPFGRRSGAHINPAVTLAFYRLGRIRAWDAFFYVLAQFVGGALGVSLSALVAPHAVMDPNVNYVVTVPGEAGWIAAAAAELAISFGLMLSILAIGGNPRSAPYTGMAAGVLVAMYIAFEAPYSGMSMNPARSAASALVAHNWTAWWIYLIAPPVAMLSAAEVYVRCAGWARVACAKLIHTDKSRCIFCELSSDKVPKPDQNRKAS